MARPGDITQLLLDWSGGDSAAADQLLSVVYRELRRLAASHLRREPRGRRLDTTELVHEAYLRLVDQKRVHWQSRHHFFGIAAQAMRRILVDEARSRLYAKRGSGRRPLPLDRALELPLEHASELIALDDALSDLAAIDREQAQIVELRYFAGLTHEEIAQLLDVSARTVGRRWRMARAWLYEQLHPGGDDGR